MGNLDAAGARWMLAFCQETETAFTLTTDLFPARRLVMRCNTLIPTSEHCMYGNIDPSDSRQPCSRRNRTSNNTPTQLASYFTFHGTAGTTLHCRLASIHIHIFTSTTTTALQHKRYLCTPSSHLSHDSFDCLVVSSPLSLLFKSTSHSSSTSTATTATPTMSHIPVTDSVNSLSHANGNTNGHSHPNGTTSSDVDSLLSSAFSKSFALKAGLAQMLKGGVIMDVTNAEEARIAEECGAVAVMALERVPSDIRKEGGVARMSNPKMIAEIQQAVTIPVMAKVRIGHFVEAQVSSSHSHTHTEHSHRTTTRAEDGVSRWSQCVEDARLSEI